MAWYEYDAPLERGRRVTSRLEVGQDPETMPPEAEGPLDDFQWGSIAEKLIDEHRSEAVELVVEALVAGDYVVWGEWKELS